MTTESRFVVPRRQKQVQGGQRSQVIMSPAVQHQLKAVSEQRSGGNSTSCCLRSYDQRKRQFHCDVGPNAVCPALRGVCVCFVDVPSVVGFLRVYWFCHVHSSKVVNCDCTCVDDEQGWCIFQLCKTYWPSDVTVSRIVGTGRMFFSCTVLFIFSGWLRVQAVLHDNGSDFQRSVRPRLLNLVQR